MPSKHIDAIQWKKIEEITLELTRTKNRMIKEGDVLKLIIEAGLKGIDTEAISHHFDFQPRYNAFLHFEVGDASLALSLDKPAIEDVIESLYPGLPFVLTVYGNTNTGKSTFINELTAALDKSYDITVYDNADSGENVEIGKSDIVRAWKNYKAGNSSIIGIHASTPDAALKKIVRAHGGPGFIIEKPNEMTVSNARAYKPTDSDEFAKSLSKVMRNTPVKRKV